ncbi:MAG: DUF6783 domain-containing protein [Lacrimispora saccharolytica]
MPTNCDAHLAESNFQTRSSQRNGKGKAGLLMEAAV